VREVEFVPEVGDDKWGRKVRESGDGQRNDSGRSDVGPGLKSWLGPVRSPRPFYSFFLFFSFSFLFFLFLL
jgi:hypothetical protein